MKPIDTAALVKQAQNSKENEAYLQMEKTQAYRIGVGARTATSPAASSFFVEVIVSLFDEKDEEVNLQKLENAVKFLKKLKRRGYTLTYEGGTCISCEANIERQKLTREVQRIKTLTEAQL